MKKTLEQPEDFEEFLNDYHIYLEQEGYESYKASDIVDEYRANIREKNELYTFWRFLKQKIKEDYDIYSIDDFSEKTQKTIKDMYDKLI